MKDRAESSNPAKTLVEEFKGFKILKSDPLKSMNEDADGTVRFAVVHPERGCFYW